MRHGGVAEVGKRGICGMTGLLEGGWLTGAVVLGYCCVSVVELE